jgi:hypothetical protein
VVEHLLRKHEALNANPVPQKKKKVKNLMESTTNKLHQTEQIISRIREIVEEIIKQAIMTFTTFKTLGT